MITERLEIGETHSLEELSAILGEELANLVSGVEGHAQLLCESRSQPQRLEEHSAQLREATRRIRFFSEKLQSYARVPQLPMEPTNVGHLLAALVLEIQEYSRGSLHVALNTAPSLPFAKAHPPSLRTAILLLLESVLELEPNASTILLQAQAQDSGDDQLQVRVDIEAVLDEVSSPAGRARPGVQYSYLAARNLLAAQDATFTLDQTKGLNVLASITLLASASTGMGTDTEIGSRDLESLGPTPAAERFAADHDELLLREVGDAIREGISDELPEALIPTPTSAEFAEHDAATAATHRDAGHPDAGRPDAGDPDAGHPDAGHPDAGDPDAGDPDAGHPDAGHPDAGHEEAPHQFAGVLIMEGNPMIRDMLCRELRRTERNIISCADGLAAHSLFDATPERFELLILEQDSRRERGDEIAVRALAQRPDIKVIMLTPGPGVAIDPGLAATPQVQILPKPFGMNELRDSLSTALGPLPERRDEAEASLT